MSYSFSVYFLGPGERSLGTIELDILQRIPYTAMTPIASRLWSDIKAKATFPAIWFGARQKDLMDGAALLI